MLTFHDDRIKKKIENCTISNNSNTYNALSDFMMASAVSVSFVRENTDNKISKLRIAQTLFVGNRQFGGKLISTLSMLSVLATIVDSYFTDNYGTAITAYTSDSITVHAMIIFSGKVLFRNNTLRRGGAIQLFKYYRIGLGRGANVLFEDNHAKDVGGLIAVNAALIAWTHGVLFLLYSR